MRPGVAYGIGLDGKVQGTLNFRAQPRDVEAVAVHEDRLYVADIGDNDGQRNSVRVYFFNNPRANGLTVTYHAYDFQYPDGPQDAETLLVDESGRLFIVTKGRTPPYTRLRPNRTVTASTTWSRSVRRHPMSPTGPSCPAGTGLRC